MKQDRFLTGILIGVLVLIITAVGMFLLRQGETGYLEENTPEAVVLNYVLAIQSGEYERAYQYLPEELGDRERPSYADFRSYLKQNRTSSAGISVISIDIDSDRAWVVIEVVQADGGLFGGIYRSQDTAELILDKDGEWKLIYMPYQFWGWEWFNQAPGFR